MKIDTLMAAAAPGKVAEQAQHYEQPGFDCVWSFEAMSDAFLPLAHAAAATKKLEVGTNIAVAFARSPFSMAQIAWDMQRDSGGRFHLGLGTQVRAHNERRISMPFDHLAARVTDYIRCISAHSEHYQHGTLADYYSPLSIFTVMKPFFKQGLIASLQLPI